MHKKLLVGLVRDLVARVQNLLNHPTPVHPVQYMNALVRTHTCLSNTLKQLNQIYTNNVLIPETQYWIDEKQVQSQATAAITLWILVGATYPQKSLGNACEPI